MSKQKFFPVTRRTVLAGTGAILATPAILRHARASVTLTVADPGGPFSPAFRKAFYGPFEELTGMTIANVAREAEPTAQFKSIVETGTFIWDVCTLTLSARKILETQDLLEPTGVEAADAPGMISEALFPNFVGTDVYSTIFAFRSDKMSGEGPKSWSDFWNVEAFPGRRALRKNPIDTLEQALLADGVPLEELYPLDVDRAFASLDKIKPHIAVWWTGGAQSTQLLQSGEVDMLSGWNARLQAAIDGGAPAQLVWNQGLYSIEGWGIPKGNPKADAAREFVKFCTRPEQQALYTSELSYGPTNQKAYDSIDAERAKVLPTAPANISQMRLASEDWWSENRAEMSERFNAWLLI
ncbi:MAG: polyamine ABC transporter substrate-binding protein [Tepidamorphaceae bacterium]